MRRISCAALAAALLVVLPGSASAAVTDGQWALIDRKGSGDRLITMNPPSDGAEVGLRTLHTAPVGVRLEAPQWSPDGNRIVFVEGARLLLYDLATAKLSEVAPEGAAPGWSPDGARIAFVAAPRCSPGPGR